MNVLRSITSLWTCSLAVACSFIFTLNFLRKLFCRSISPIKSKMASFFVVIFVLLCCTSGNPFHGNREQTKVCIDIFCLFFKLAYNYCRSWMYFNPNVLFFPTRSRISLLTSAMLRKNTRSTRWTQTTNDRNRRKEFYTTFLWLRVIIFKWKENKKLTT